MGWEGSSRRGGQVSRSICQSPSMIIMLGRLHMCMAETPAQQSMLACPPGIVPARYGSYLPHIIVQVV